jgi:3-oxoadipate enol-lactonase
MPTHAANGAQLFYRVAGDGAETVVLSHSFLVDHRQFDAQIAELSEHFRVIAYDHRGHGRSADPGAAYSMDDIYADAESLIEALVDGPCHFVGLSTGGFVGLRLAFRRPDLVNRLVLMDTSADLEGWKDRARYAVMLRAVPFVGYRPLMGSVMKTMFGPRFLADESRRDDVALWRQRMMESDRHAIARFGRAIFAREPVEDRLVEIQAPTLVITGASDAAQIPERARRMAEGIAGSRFELVPHAGHLSTIEEPEAVNALLLSFLSGGNSA